MHVLMLLAALSTGAEVTIDPSSLSEPASQVEVTLFEGTSRVKSFTTATTLTLKPGAYRVTTGGLELGRFKVNEGVSDVSGALTPSLAFDVGKLKKVNIDASSLASGAELLVRINDSISLGKPVTVFLPNGEFRVGAYGSFTVAADGVKSKTLNVTSRGIGFEPSKYTRVDFVVDDLSSGGVKQVFAVKDVVKLEDNATVFFADDTFEFGRIGAKPFGTFTTKKGRVSASGGLSWDETTHSLHVDRKSLDRVTLDFTAFQRGMGSADPLWLLDAQSTVPSVRLIGSGAAYLQRGTYTVSDVLGSFATAPVASTSGGVSWTIAADATLLVSLKLSGKREFHVSPFTRSRSTWQLSLPKGRYALRAPDGRALTTLIVDPPRASLEATTAGVTLTTD